MGNDARETPVRDGRGRTMARLDIERAERCGAPEAVFALRKSPAETEAIVKALIEKQGCALVTRADAETLSRLRKRWKNLKAAPHGGTALVGKPPRKRAAGEGWVAIAAAGTSDLAVVEEAELTLDAVGIPSRAYADIGVAGLHRLLGKIDEIAEASAVIAVAGMEGALPSVIAGLVSAPVIATPTSVGYGVSGGGYAALLGMLGSCAPGVVVVNIDNGFGAAVAAAKMLNIGRINRA